MSFSFFSNIDDHIEKVDDLLDKLGPDLDKVWQQVPDEVIGGLFSKAGISAPVTPEMKTFFGKVEPLAEVTVNARVDPIKETVDEFTGRIDIGDLPQTLDDTLRLIPTPGDALGAIGALSTPLSPAALLEQTASVAATLGGKSGGPTTLSDMVDQLVTLKGDLGALVKKLGLEKAYPAPAALKQLGDPDSAFTKLLKTGALTAPAPIAATLSALVPADQLSRLHDVLTSATAVMPDVVKDPLDALDALLNPSAVPARDAALFSESVQNDLAAAALSLEVADHLVGELQSAVEAVIATFPLSLDPGLGLSLGIDFGAGAGFAAILKAGVEKEFSFGFDVGVGVSGVSLTAAALQCLVTLLATLKMLISVALSWIGAYQTSPADVLAAVEAKLPPAAA